MRSEIQLFDFQDSPERILLHLSEKAQIVGISATATLDTVVGNYDLEYLQRMLQDKFYVMPEADRCRLQESFQTFVANYDKVNIHVEPVSYNADDRVELSEIFNGNEALIKKYAEKLSISFERVEYAKNNFIRVVKVMKAFILNNSVKSLLCLNNKLPQENKGLFDIKLLEEFADAIIKLYGIKGLKGKDLLYSINSEDYEAKRAELYRDCQREKNSLSYLPIIQLVRDKICNIKHRGMILSWQLMITIEEIWKKTLTAYILRSRQIFW